jgi:hypothetical protein
LSSQGGQERIGRPRESSTKGVANRSEDDAVVGFNAVTHDRVVAGERVGHCVGVLLPAPGAAFNIGKEKGDRPDRQISHSPPPRIPQTNASA